jgi:transcriptional regulator with XRE-family HTH domain
MRDMTTGMDLRLERTAARVRLQELAARMGRHPATLHRWELSAVVPATRAAEYRAALATFAEDATQPKAA